MGHNKDIGYSILVPLSEHVETMDDWEIVEYASRYQATSKYYRNGATEAKIKEVLRVWNKRYPDDDILLLECVAPLEYSITRFFDNVTIEERKEDE